MDRLSRLENESIYILREGYYLFRKSAVLWSIGKDSTAMLWLMRKAFLGKIPFPVIHIDTTFKFPEMYRSRDEWAKKWKLPLKIVRNEAALKKGIGYQTHDAFTCCHELKTLALKNAIEKYKWKALFVGIRRDEHGIRGKERVFSPRNEKSEWDYTDQPLEMWELFKPWHATMQHVRIHPLLGWTEADVWEYTRREKIPVNPLYFSKNGKRYRSLGCMPITHPVVSEADTMDKIIEEIKSSTESERKGRAQDKEEMYTMQKLRSLGYM